MSKWFKRVDRFIKFLASVVRIVYVVLDALQKNPRPKNNLDKEIDNHDNGK